MTLRDQEFMRLTAAWVAKTDVETIETGLELEEAVCRAHDFLQLLCEGKVVASEIEIDDPAIDVIRGSCRVVADGRRQPANDLLKDARTLYRFISEAKWFEPDFGERAELLCDCAFIAWRDARQRQNPALAYQWRHEFGTALRLPSPLWDQIKAAPVSDEQHAAVRPDLKNSEVLLALCERVRDLLETSPLRAKAAAEFLFQFISGSNQPVGILDEDRYFLGETAFLAGIACRLLAQRDNATRWFDRAESSFQSTANALADASRVGYHRLALCLEERRFRDFFERLPVLRDVFGRLCIADEALKCHILEGLAQMETGEITLAAETFESALQEARNLSNGKLVASCYVNLIHTHGMLGNTESALAFSKEVVPILLRQDNRVSLAQVQLGVGSLFRAKMQLSSAVEAYRGALTEFESIGMQADVASTRLMIAEVLIEMEQEPLAFQEILRALPVIDEYRMVPESVAALSLLRESVRQQRLNREALRDLRGYFKEFKGWPEDTRWRFSL